MWTKIIGGSSNDVLYKVIKLESGGYVVCGGTQSGTGGDKSILIKIA